MNKHSHKIILTLMIVGMCAAGVAQGFVWHLMIDNLALASLLSGFGGAMIGGWWSPRIIRYHHKKRRLVEWDRAVNQNRRGV